MKYYLIVAFLLLLLGLGFSLTTPGSFLLSNSRTWSEDLPKLYISNNRSKPGHCFISNLYGSTLRRGDDPDKGKSSRCYRDSKGRWLIMRKSKPSLFLIPVESITDINSLKTGLLSWSVAQLFVDRIFVGGFVYASFPEDPWSLNKWSQENRRRIFIQGREYGICVDSLIRPNEVCRPPIAVIESDLLVESLFDFPIPDFHWKKWPKEKISSSTMPEDYSEELEVQIQKLRKLDAKFKGRFK